jgi:predicted enzyme related to lactoylglutathione lyase
MARPAGSFIWYELMTADAAAAAKLYGAVVVATDPHGAAFGVVGPKGR